MGHREEDGTDPREDATRANASNPTLRCIAVGRRREILRALLSRGEPATDRELADLLAAADGADPAADEAATERRTVRRNLVHRHLPALEAAGLVARDRDDTTVETTTHPALEDPRFRRLLGLDAENLDEVLSALSHEHRRIALTVLRDGETTMSRTAIAEEILRRETVETDSDPESVDEIAVSLHHSHLPNLADAGLVEYERETGRTAYTGHPTLEAVFEIVYESDERLVDKFDGFLDGLGVSSEKSADASEQLDWPHFWWRPNHG